MLRGMFAWSGTSPAPVERGDWLMRELSDATFATVGSLVPAVFVDYVRIANVRRQATGGQWPRLGCVAPDVLAQMMRVLCGDRPDHDPLFIGLWDGYGWLETLASVDPEVRELMRGPRLELPRREYILRSAPCSKVPILGWAQLQLTDHQSPNICWPAGREWFIASDIDVAYSFVGCSRGTADDLLAMSSNGLDAIRVAADDLIDIGERD